MKEKCLICGIEGKPGFTLYSLQNDPYFCERCLFLSLTKGLRRQRMKYAESFEPRDVTLPSFHTKNIWKEDV